MDRTYPPRPRRGRAGLALGLLLAAGSSLAFQVAERTEPPEKAAAADPALENAEKLISQGRATFRYDRLGSHTFFSRTLKLHRALATLSPRTALSVGVKVDSEVLPREVVEALLAGAVDLDDPAVTLALFRLNAVVGVVGEFTEDGTLFEAGITCALCHSTVDDSVAPGIGRRLDGWANRDLDVGTILSLSPRLEPVAQLLGVDVGTVRAVLASWGPGKF
ncbi:MAG: hypothetical protein KDD47_22345, partial [Acidobacteria bacterium]|nr:hypothetical protein [Acidobacteriota bacterium]